MLISDLAIKRPVLATVASILIVLVGLLSFASLPVREYPDTDTPTVSVTTIYPGASAEVVESKVTEPLEEQISAIDGIRVMKSASREQVSQITIEFNLERDVDEAANDVRDRVGRARGRLPDEVEEPQIAKVESDANPFMWIAFYSDRYSRLELTDFADRFAKQRIQTVPGVGNIIIGGEKRFAMRLWLDPERLAAHGLTAADVEQALREQNVDVPGGRIESVSREFTIRTEGDLAEASEFERMVVAERDGFQIRLEDVGRAELGSEDYRTVTYYNGKPTVGLGVVRQSRSNLLDVAAGVKKLLPVIRAELPPGIEMDVAFDSSLFVERSVNEVFTTLAEAVALVILVIFLFLRNARATLIPLTAIPVSLIGTFAVMAAMGFTINVLTLLAIVLAVGLVVDDAIVMLENIFRKIEEGEAPIHAAVFGAREVAFAVIATTLTLAAVFLPVAFQTGSTGRLFYEFGLTLAAAVLVSSFVALTLTPMLCSRLLRGARRDNGKVQESWLHRWTEPAFVAMNRGYERALRLAMRGGAWVIVGALAFTALAPVLYGMLKRELVPIEDRGNFLAFFRGPLGSTPEFTQIYVKEMADIVSSEPEVRGVFSVTAFGRGTPGNGNEGIMFSALNLWEDRERKTQDVMAEVGKEFRDKITGGLAFPVPIKPLGQRGAGEGIQFVIQGTDFGRLERLADDFLKRMRESGLFMQPRRDPQPNKPQLTVLINRPLAADLGVPISVVASTLETMFGSRQVTEFKRNNKQYDVIMQVEDQDRRTAGDLNRLYVRSEGGALVPLSNLVDTRETITPESYPHYGRLRSVTLIAQMAQGHTLGEGIEFLREAAEELPSGFSYAWDGESREFVESSGDTLFLFGLALLFTFFILAAQFESYIHPITIYAGVGLAMTGGLMGLHVVGWFGETQTDNLFSRFGLIMLIGLVAKNGILIVEFANQLQLAGRDAAAAAYEAATLRFRPILMTAISTIFGALPIAMATGAGAESRNPLGIVVVSGLGVATVLTLFVVPVVYVALDGLVRRTTGHGSAAGLAQAASIDEEIRAAAGS